MRKFDTAALKACLMLGVAGIVPISVPAMAQSASQGQEEAEAEDDGDLPIPTASAMDRDRIIVTGSRIARPEYSATSPMVTIDADQLEESAAINLEANLNRLPQFTPALTQFNAQDIQANANNTVGISTVSLRSLGSNRNLVLVDGRRGTPINGSGVIDINSIPSAAVRRVEVITGGASSTYGADAVGGVVNFILRDDFEGVDLDAQGSVTEEGDGFEYTVSALIGAALADGRGNVLIGLEHYDRSEVFRQDRRWFNDLARSPLTSGTDARITQNFIDFSNSRNLPSQAAYNSVYGIPDGLANVPRSGSLYFNDDNSLWLNGYDAPSDRFVVVNYNDELDGFFRKISDDGRLYENFTDQLLSSPQDRWAFFSKGEYDITDSIRLVGQAYYAMTETRSVSFYNSMSGSVGVEIPYDNEIYTGNADFDIPSSVLANGNTNPDFLSGGLYGLDCPAVGGCTNRQVYPVTPDMVTLLNSRANPNASYRVNVIPTAFGRRRTENRNQTFNMLLGLEGDVGGTDWTWDITASHGETTAKTDQYGYVSVERWRTIMQAPNFGRNFAVTADNVYGATATCTTGLSPLVNPGDYSADCQLATSIDLQLENRVVQEYIEANLQGGLFDLPYGELRFALGTHYRENSIDFHADSSSVEGSTFYETAAGTFPQASTSGKTNVKEIYGELLVPLVNNLPFAEALNLELGYRLSDYQSVGTVHTYKINGEYAPFDWLRFRGGYQVASRAPNLGELFTARTQTLRSSADGDACSIGLITQPVGYGNYSANPIDPSDPDDVGNPNAAQVRGLCEATMTADAVEAYYNDPDRVFPQVGFSVPSLEVGARELQEETAITYTIGGVIQSPSDNPWLRRLNLAIDYYNVTIKDGIDLQGPDSVLRQCYSAIFNPNYEINDACNRIRRDDQSGNIELIEVNYANLGRVETSGVDANLTWGVGFRDVGVPVPGRLNINVNATYVVDFKTTPDQFVIPMTDYTGSTGGGDVGTQSSPFEYRLLTRVSYSVGPATIGVQWQHFPSLVHSTTLTNTGAPIISNTPSYNLFNLNGRFVVSDSINVRFGVDNLFNKAPPLASFRLNDVLGDRTLPGGSYSFYHNTIGRRLYAGVNVGF
ncbi:TonB-dependent receptor [Altererythrobacter sp. KTW20L]|uniref:TonB-dependent receptor domain-containing protein n=1 Tax=Altererythrobacter sp. KTW20L TaxID=2942210 RepID=UPI0020BDE927|nr:TonB-dependent receptor [Altererythrobacter sp. KTW20L]MCL6252003.1 TonB-dependent receptor [Altererythrobacter sp. KTW20L]